MKGIKLSDADQEIYTAFNHVNSERWQQEIAGIYSWCFCRSLPSPALADMENGVEVIKFIC